MSFFPPLEVSIPTGDGRLLEAAMMGNRRQDGENKVGPEPSGTGPELGLVQVPVPEYPYACKTASLVRLARESMWYMCSVWQPGARAQSAFNLP